MKLNIMLLLLLLLAAAAVSGHNITAILAPHPSLSTFNHYLTTTHLAGEINRRRTITVCAVDNAAMSALLSHNYPLPTLKNILSLHVFADYFGSKKLHQITKGSTTTSTLFQASGEAAGTSGYVNITDMKGGKVGFTPVDSDVDPPMATFVKSIRELPYNISVIQISNILTSAEAEAPISSPTDLNQNLSPLQARLQVLLRSPPRGARRRRRDIHQQHRGRPHHLLPLRRGDQIVRADLQKPYRRRADLAAALPRRAGVQFAGDAEIQQRIDEHAGHGGGEEVRFHGADRRRRRQAAHEGGDGDD